MNSLITTGRIFYAVAIIAFGVIHFVAGDFVTRVIPWWPAWMPARTLSAYAVGALLIAAGGSLLANRHTVLVANLLGLALLLSFVVLGLPMAAAGVVLGGGWTRAGKALALSGGAFLIAQSLSRRSSEGAQADVANAAGHLPAPRHFNQGVARLWKFGPWCFAAFFVLCGVQHFANVQSVQTLVPTWIPGARVWTYVAGALLIGGGIGVLFPPTSRLAALLSGLMVFIWVIILHIPRALSASSGSTNETTAVFEALAMSGIAWLIAAMSAARQNERSVLARPSTRLAAAVER